MGKLREQNQCHDEAAAIGDSKVSLPPPPPLQPRPGMLTEQRQQLESARLLLLPTKLSSMFMQTLEEDAGHQEPLDYTMKHLQQQYQQQQQQHWQSRQSMSPSPASPPLPTASNFSSSSSSSPSQPSPSSPADQVLHRLRHTVLQRHRQQQPIQLSMAKSTTSALTARDTAAPGVAIGGFPRPAATTAAAAAAAGGRTTVGTTVASSSLAMDPVTHDTAAYVASCIKSRLDGCGKRVHLFLGILLHFGMPPGDDGQQIFDRVIAFSDAHKNLSERPTAYFMVLESRLLALIWSKFKGNSSNEYSTLTRAIRSTRQKYKGIFEAIPNPGKKLYKFGPVAMEQFRQLFPSSYADEVKLEQGSA